MGIGQSKKKVYNIEKINTIQEEERLLDNLPEHEKSLISNDGIDFFHQNHFFMKAVWSTNFSSPIKDKLKEGAIVLDVFCGAGTFLLELSNEYQSSEFIGIDRTKLFPVEIKPKNLSFANANILEGLPFRDNYFDFVRLNIQEPLCSLNQWNFVIEELIRVTKPSGSVEMQGYDCPDEYIGPKFMNIFQNFSSLFEMDLRPRCHIESLFSASNLQRINHDYKTIRIGKSGGNLGILLGQHLTMFFKDVFGEPVTNKMNISMDEYAQDWNEVLEDEPNNIMIYRIWGIKI